MNAARLSVGLEGYAIGERAYQHAVEWARTRIQGRPPVPASEGPLSIIHHPDIKRMLLVMKSTTEACRAVALYAAYQLDIAGHHPDDKQRAAAQARAELLIPSSKGWCTETGKQIAGIGVQIHGGMGFIEETGAAQYIRDARITTIYEGTTGIQSNDLIGRKIGRDGGAAMNQLITDMSRELQGLETAAPAASAARKAALESVGLLKDSTDSLVKALASRPDTAMAVSVPYLMLCGYVIGGWLTARAAAIAARNLTGPDRTFYDSKLHKARFYAEQVLPTALALARTVQGGAESVVDTDAALI